MGKRNQRGVQFVYSILVVVAVGLHKNLGQHDRGCDGGVIRLLDPREDGFREPGVARVVLQVVNEDVGIQRNASMAAQEAPQVP